MFVPLTDTVTWLFFFNPNQAYYQDDHRDQRGQWLSLPLPQTMFFMLVTEAEPGDEQLQGRKFQFQLKSPTSNLQPPKL
ncbi:unnamed protein product [Ambrosiozyma monospora]|uniref:Unnamed protein product n=1 Tax=Ambrosiozyma monospora TaxID=43982 RepID=A0ACB5TDB9_AMBMO|nr:unnamed protein product [Ambrosiozyma monospora]